MADWRWECVTDELLDRLPPDAVRAVRQLAEELAVRESMVFLDGPGFTGDPRIENARLLNPLPPSGRLASR